MTVDFRLDSYARDGCRAEIPTMIQNAHSGIQNLHSGQRLQSASPPVFAIAQRPTARELAGLVHELFTEGSLTWEQLHTLSSLPEFGSMLTSLAERASPLRRPMAAE